MFNIDHVFMINMFHYLDCIHTAEYCMTIVYTVDDESSKPLFDNKVYCSCKKSTIFLLLCFLLENKNVVSPAGAPTTQTPNITQRNKRESHPKNR